MKTLIAECGSNHEGKFDRAVELMDMAWNSGAHICKFQLWTDPEITARGNIPLPFEMFESLWALNQVRNKNSQRKMVLTASVFDDESLDFLLKLKPAYIKFSYAKRDWALAIKRASNSGITPIISTDILSAQKTFQNYCFKKITLFCIPEYPVTHIIDFKGLSQSYAWDFINGFSDHTCGIDQTIRAADTKNVQYIEKHIRLETGSVPDHSFSIGKSELLQLTKALNIEPR